MALEWREVQLGDVANLITGYPFKSQHYTDDAEAPRLIGGDNIAQGNLRWDSVRRWPLDMTHGLDDYWLEPGDVVLAMDRPWIEAGLKRAAVGPHDVPSLLIQRTSRLRGTDELDTAFLRYVVGSQAFTQYILSVQTGTAVPHISPAQIRAYSFLLPPPPDQRTIAHILGTLDDKIELNRRRNQTLEAMARALFKDWFVDFGPVRAKMEGRDTYLPADLWQLFPDRLDDEGKPEGWGIHPLNQIAALVTSSIAPGKSPEAIFEHYSIPAFDAARMPAMEVGESIKSNKYIVDPNSVLVSKLNPQTPRVWLPAVATDRAICSTEFMQFVPHDRENRSYVYCLMCSEAMQEVVLQHVTGSTGSRQRAQPSQIAKINILTPGPGVVMAFNRQAGPILKAVGQNQRESQTLAQLRDTLLPKMISGELRIQDAEQFIEAAQ